MELYEIYDSFHPKRHLWPGQGSDRLAHNPAYGLLHLAAINLELLRSVTVHRHLIISRSPKKEKADLFKSALKI